MTKRKTDNTMPTYRGKDIELKLAFLQERGYHYDAELGQWLNDALSDKHFRFVSEEMIGAGNFESFTKSVFKNETDDLIFFSGEEIA